LHEELEIAGESALASRADGAAGGLLTGLNVPRAQWTAG
jgi:hypothetical protein